MKFHTINQCILCPVVLLISFMLVSALLVSQARSLPANSMWIEPSDIRLDTASVGTRFNITIWLNMSTPTNSWQFYLIYNRIHLHALRCDYTGENRSLWAGNSSPFTVPPSFGYHNGSFGYVLHGETLTGGVEKTGVGSLSWVEFNVTKLPSNATSEPVRGEFRLDIPHPIANFTSYALNSHFNVIPISFGESVYTIPEFPLSAMLTTFFAIASVIALVLRPKTRQALH